MRTVRQNRRAARRAFDAKPAADLQVLRGAAVLTEDEALSILKEKLEKMTAGLHGYSMEELLEIAPILLQLTQIEGKSEFYVLTNDEISKFVGQLGEQGWTAANFPQPLGPQDKTPVNSKIRYGVCKHDLPPSAATDAKWRADEKATLSRGEQWELPEWHQPKRERKQGAVVYLHMSCRLVFPDFNIKDGKGAQVAERDVKPDAHSAGIFSSIILARDTKEHSLTLQGNLKILRRAAQYTIWASRNPWDVEEEHDATAPELPVTFVSLKMHQPVYQRANFNKLNIRLSAAIDELENGGSVIPQGADVFSEETKKQMAKFIDGY